MANYRFKTAEIEAMKKNILTHIEREAETKTAWRLRCAIEGQLMCCRPSKRDAARLERELALYEKLTKNDLPNWQSEPTQPATPTETPQISTEAAEVTNVSTEGGNAENEPIKHISEIMETCRTWDDEKRDYTDEYKYYTWLANHIPEHKATNKNTTELILEKVRERISAAATLAAHGVPKCDIEGAVCAVVNRLAKMEDVLQFCNHKEPPQSPGTPQAAECIADTPKPRETARKPQNRGIGNTRHSRLGANGYAVLNDASATLTAMSVPRECSTADYW